MEFVDNGKSADEIEPADKLDQSGYRVIRGPQCILMCRRVGGEDNFLICAVNRTFGEGHRG